MIPCAVFAPRERDCTPLLPAYASFLRPPHPSSLRKRESTTRQILHASTSEQPDYVSAIRKNLTPIKPCSLSGRRPEGSGTCNRACGTGGRRCRWGGRCARTTL